MSRRIPSYEDYFRIPTSTSEQNDDNDVKQAATILADKALSVFQNALGIVSKHLGIERETHSVDAGPMDQGHSFRERKPTGWQNEHYRVNPQLELGDRSLPNPMPVPGMPSPMEPMMRGEPSSSSMHYDYKPEMLRPLETCESYERNRRQAWEQGPPHDHEQEMYGAEGRPGNQRNDFTSVPDQYREYGMQQNRPGPTVGDGDYGWQPFYDDDKQPHYDKQPYSYTDRRFSQQPFNERQRDSLALGYRFEFENKDSHHQQFVGDRDSEHQKQPCGFSSNTSGSKMDQGNDEDEEDTSYCKLCDVRFDNPQKYYQHTRGLLHTQRQMAANKSELGGTEEEQQQQPEQDQEQGPQQQQQPEQDQEQGPQQQQQQPATSEDNNDEDFEEDYWEQEWEEEPKNGSELVCELCDIKMTGIEAFRSHENGRSHKAVQEAVDKGTVVPQRIYSKLGPKSKIPEKSKPAIAAILDMKACDGPSVLLDLVKNIPEAVVGTAYIKEGRLGKSPSFLCVTCESPCDTAGILSHLIGSKHRMKYLRAHHPSIYEHVKSHGGKKSQLSAFLEEVCSDIEKREGRKEPMMSKPEKTEKQEGQKQPMMSKPEKPDGEEKEPEKDETKKSEKTEETSDSNKAPKEEITDKQSGKSARFARGKLPHEVVMAMYREGKVRDPRSEARSNRRRRDWDGPIRDWDGPMVPFRFGGGREGSPLPGCGPFRFDDGREGPPGPGPFRFDDGREGPPEFGPSRFGPPPPDTYFPRRPGLYPPYMDCPPEPYLSEEERLRRMYDYEGYVFDHPMLFVSPEEARCRMLNEYERLGIPYDIACDRILIVEDRRVKLMAYMQEGLSLNEAQARLKRLESRKQLIREYEQQGLEPREAHWRVIVEEERSKLFEKYEQLGFSPLEARAKIMAGEDRMHLIQEFERHGMTPEEAHRRAVNEEDRLKVSVDKPSSREQSLDDIADRRLLESYMEHGDSKEQAENKVIAILRRQGVPTQEAILRVQKIDVKVPERRRSPDIPERQTSRDRGTSSTSRDDCGGSTKPSSRDDHGGSTKPTENLDNITPEEAKERLFQEYEKRGVPREKARLALIQELVRSGVPAEEAKRRFSDTRPQEKANSREGGRKRKKYTGYERSRSRSSSSSDGSLFKRRHSPSADWKTKSSREERDERLRLSPERKREGTFSSFRRAKEYDRRSVGNKEKKEPPSRPTLTLGEEIKQKARKLKREEFLRSRMEEKSSSKLAVPGSSQNPAENPSLEPKKGDNVSDLLESLTDNLISSGGNESVALSMSKALTSALLKYRLTSTDEKEKPSGSMSTSNSFMERRIQDAKKLFETKMMGPKDNPGPSGSSTSRGGGYQSSGGASRQEAWGQLEAKSSPRSVRPESFGLPPPLPVHSREYSSAPQSYSAPFRQSTAEGGYSSGSMSSQQGHHSQVRNPIVPRVLMTLDRPAKGSTSKSRRLL